VHMAAMNGFLDCFKKLVALMLNFNVDCIDKSGRTCLHAAACGGSVFRYFVVLCILYILHTRYMCLHKLKLCSFSCSQMLVS